MIVLFMIKAVTTPLPTSLSVVGSEPHEPTGDNTFCDL